MKTVRKPTAKNFDKNQSYHQAENLEERAKPSKSSITRRSFLGRSLAVGAGTVGAGFFINTRIAAICVWRATGKVTPLLLLQVVAARNQCLSGRLPIEHATIDDLESTEANPEKEAHH